MLFNSFQYLIFFPIVVCAFFALPNRYRWILLLAASWYFYACWNFKYLFLLILTTTVDYLAGIMMGRASTVGRKKIFMGVSLALNLGVLFFFKYYNFAMDSLTAAFSHFNLMYHAPELRLLLPVGVSFYTFQSLTYTIGVYRGTQKPERHFGIFATYVSFFPQLVAGPIERSSHLLPQFQPSSVKRFDFERTMDGLGLILWGLMKKVVVADRLAYYVEATYGHVSNHTGVELLVATYLFAFQIYCDFSGYSDIAIGSARIMGFDLMTNFRQPYFATSIREFWQRWHISLSTWFRDYVYIPLGGNRRGMPRWYANLFITFLLSGIWHGANWTFVIWGALHGAYLVTALVTQQWRDRLLAALRLSKDSVVVRAWQTFATFNLVAIGWVFFRANNVSDAFTVFSRIGSAAFSGVSSWAAALTASGLWRIPDLAFMFTLAAIVCTYEVVQAQGRRMPRPAFALRPAYASVLGVSLQFWMIVVFGMFNNKAFIYFQF